MTDRRTAPTARPPRDLEIRAALVADDRVLLVRRDGELEELLAPGHPRPGTAHSTARSAP